MRLTARRSPVGRGIEASDVPHDTDPNTANIDPFFEETTIFMSCDVVEPADAGL
jgi:glutamine synthetase